MKYELSILKRLVETYGVIGNPRYLSEIIKEFIVRGKELYPQLFTYQSDWLAHIDEFGLTPEYTVSYTGQHIYAPNTKEKPVKRAILKGSTKYCDVDTGEVLEAFDEGRNLELVSVKMPVLKTTGKNLFSFDNVDTEVPLVTKKDSSSIELNGNGRFDAFVFTLNLEPNTTYTLGYTFHREIGDLTLRGDRTCQIEGATSTNIRIFYTSNENNTPKSVQFTTGATGQVTIRLYGSNDAQTYKTSFNNVYINKSNSVGYEPYKSNILTVNEDVTLRSNGDICDELNLLTGQLTQRIGEDGVVLSQEAVKTVDLTIHDKDHQKVERLTSFEGGTHFTTSSQDGSLLPTLTVDVVTDLDETLMVCSLEGNTM